MTNPPLAVRLRMQARKYIVIGWLSVWYAAAIPKKTAAQKNRMLGMSFVTSVIKKVGLWADSVAVTREENTLSDILETEHGHDKTLSSKTPACMRRHTVFERV